MRAPVQGCRDADESRPSSPAAVTSVPSALVACRDCTLFRLCLPVGTGSADLDLLDRIIKRPRLLPKGAHLFRPGDRFGSVLAVRAGSVETYTIEADARREVVAFHLPGELLALDAIGAGVHRFGARTLEATSLCEVPFDRLEAIGARVPTVQRQLVRIMSQQILHDQSLRSRLATAVAEERLAIFLMDFSDRIRRRGYSGTQIPLSMSRRAIGRFLGLAKETVCRLFARLERDGLLEVRGRSVRILDADRLAALGRMPAPEAGLPRDPGGVER